MSNPINVQTQAAPFAGASSILSAVSPTHLVNGFRTSKVVGATVVNEMDATIGTVDDLIVSATDKSAFAVLSVGGFLGIGAKYVVVPYSNLESRNETTNLLLRGATTESLKNLPEYTYRA